MISVWPKSGMQCSSIKWQEANDKQILPGVNLMIPERISRITQNWHVCIFVLLKSDNKFDTVIYRIIFYSVYHDKFYFVLNFIQLLLITARKRER